VRCAAHQDPSRRDVLTAGIAAGWAATSLAPIPSAIAAAPSPTTIQVPQDAATVIEALAMASDGDIVLLAAGTYNERAILTRAITLAAAPGAAVILSHETSSPYESTIVIAADGAVVRDISIRHNSPSIANCYAVQATSACGTTARLERCDVSSVTGSGVGVEGGAITIVDCRVHDCARSGVAVFSDMEGVPGRPMVQRCKIEGNKAHGVLVRDGAEPNVLECVMEGHGGYGMALQGCGGVYWGNKMRGNRAGAMAVNLLAETLDPGFLAQDNGLKRAEVIEVALKSAV
jgi:nitrous oxidase accessory protein NosD